MRKVLLPWLALILLLPISQSAAVEKSVDPWSVKRKIVYVALTPGNEPNFWTERGEDAPATQTNGDMLEFVKIVVNNSMEFWKTNSANKVKFATPQFFIGNPGTAYKRCSSTADIKLGMKIAGLKKIPKGTHLVVANINDACGYGGLGQQGGNTVNLKSLSTTALAHELGHNFGFRHSSALYCKGSDYSKFNSSNCSVNEYGDFRDIMGNDEWCPNTTLSATQRAITFGAPSAKEIMLGTEITVDESRLKSENLVYQLKYKNNWYFFEYFNPGKDKCMFVTGLAYGPQLQVRMIGPSWMTKAGGAVGPLVLNRLESELPNPVINFESDGVPIIRPYGGWSLSGFVAGESFQLPGAPFVLSVRSTGPATAIFTVSKV